MGLCVQLFMQIDGKGLGSISKPCHDETLLKSILSVDKIGTKAL